MNHLRGFGKIAIAGTEYPVKFGINQTEVFCDLENCNLNDYNSLFATYKGEDGKLTNRFLEQKVKLSTLKNLLLSAFLEGAEEKEQPCELTPKKVGNLMDHMTAEHWKYIMLLILGKEQEEADPNGPGVTEAPKEETLKVA